MRANTVLMLHRDLRSLAHHPHSELYRDAGIDAGATHSGMSSRAPDDLKIEVSHHHESQQHHWSGIN